jgi:hypothetical protein
VLFSDDEIAKTLDEGFECSWEMVRPVVRCEIDFGNGHKLSRTLNGNVATYFCTSEGEVFDIVPGVVTREEFLARLALAKKFSQTIAALPDASRKEAVKRYHELMKTSSSASREQLQRVADTTRMRPDMSKVAVEQRIKDAMHGAADLVAARARTAPAERHDMGKSMVERPVKNALHEDTAFNAREREPKIHDLLARRVLEKPAAITKTVYKEILDVDLDDPYLGLAPYVLGGEPGRHEP